MHTTVRQEGANGLTQKVGVFEEDEQTKIEDKGEDKKRLG